MKKKYIMTNETKTLEDGTILHRIQAIRNFGDVKKGDIGGFIEKEENLSHEGNCWVYDDAFVSDHAAVYGDAKIHDHSWVADYAQVYDNAVIKDRVSISGNAKVYGIAKYPIMPLCVAILTYAGVPKYVATV